MESDPKFKKVIEGADALSLGISIVVAILIGIGIGYGLKKLTGIHWLFWLGVAWG
ncbi:AtpZ/AtpI family protein, partial [Helicobacter bizzozeronii]